VMVRVDDGEYGVAHMPHLVAAGASTRSNSTVFPSAEGRATICGLFPKSQ